MKKFESLDHTADLKIKASGKTLEEAFLNAALGGYNFLVDIKKVKPRLKKNISVRASKVESLLYDFLEELIFLTDTEKFLFCGAKDMKIEKKGEDFFLTCTALGDDYKSYKTKGDIKAVTYSEMKIEKTKGGYEIIVVYDI